MDYAVVDGFVFLVWDTDSNLNAVRRVREITNDLLGETLGIKESKDIVDNSFPSDLHGYKIASFGLVNVKTSMEKRKEASLRDNRQRCKESIDKLDLQELYKVQDYIAKLHH